MRFEFWHDGEQLYYAQYDSFSLWSKLRLVWYILSTDRVVLKTVGGEGTITKGGLEYKL